MPPLATYLMNSTRREYVPIGNRYPEMTGVYLAALEDRSNWDLRRDTIFISHSYTKYDYTNIMEHLYDMHHSNG